MGVPNCRTVTLTLISYMYPCWILLKNPARLTRRDIHNGSLLGYVLFYIVDGCAFFFPFHSLSKENICTSPEAAVFRRHYRELKAVIQSPEIVADELFARGSIDSGVKEKVHLHTNTTSQKCEILLHAIELKISVDPDEFHVLINVLQKEPATKEIADSLFRRK